jgi:AraC family transcriptional regulator, melibiose operon regulatory protein
MMPASTSFDIYRFGFRGLRCENVARSERPQRYSEVAISIFRHGWSDLMYGGRLIHIEPMQMHIHWGAVPHQPSAFSERSLFWVIIIPLPWFLTWRLPDAFRHHVLAGEYICEPDTGRGELDCLLFDQWERDLRDADRAQQQVAALEVEARLQRFARTAEAVRPREPDASPDQGSHGERVGEMLRYVAEHYRKPIQIADIARAVNMHPNSAMRLFKRSWGSSLNRFLTEYRLWQAQSLLATGDQKIPVIAAESGFGSVTQFHDMFRRTLGTTPAAYRASFRKAAS